jgi:sugar transferase (PEP-CTERM/EpsH1 system associated)
MQRMETQLQIASPIDPVAASRPSSPKKRLRVLHVVSCLGMGGTEHGVLKIVRALGSTEFEHRICAVRNVDEDFAARMKTEAAVCTVGSAKAGLQFPFFRLSQLMKRFRPHIVHTRNFGALEAIPAARMNRVPVTIHSEHGYELEVLAGLPFRRRVICSAFYGLADQIFTVSNELRNYHSRQAWRPVDKIRVIYNGVDTDQFRPRPELRTSLRSELGILPYRFVVGTVGRIVPIKDHDTLLAAAEIMVRQKLDVHLLIVGSGPELARLQARAAASSELRGRATFLGATDKVAELLNSMDVFVLPSVCEGMSNTVLEAMATGLPLVVTNAGGNPELVEEGVIGNLFAPRDVQALSCLLSRMVKDTDLRRGYGRVARERAVERFSLTAMARDYRDLYLNLAAQHDLQKGS